MEQMIDQMDFSPIIILVEKQHYDLCLAHYQAKFPVRSLVFPFLCSCDSTMVYLNIFIEHLLYAQSCEACGGK